MTTQDYYKLTPDASGWRTLPNGNKFQLGNSARIGDNAIIGNSAKVGDYAIIGDYATIGNSAKIGDNAIIGDYATIGNSAKIGDNATIGNCARIGDNAKVGNSATIGDNAIFKPNQTTEELNEYFISNYPVKSIFWKFVTKDMMSPCWGNSKPIKYVIGKIISEPLAVKSDQQCTIGLHVFRPGILPEFVGLNNDKEELICLEVEVYRKDICFGGLPGNDSKIRVKKLKVLRKIIIK